MGGSCCKCQQQQQELRTIVINDSQQFDISQMPASKITAIQNQEQSIKLQIKVEQFQIVYDQGIQNSQHKKIETYEDNKEPHKLSSSSDSLSDEFEQQEERLKASPNQNGLRAHSVTEQNFREALTHTRSVQRLSCKHSRNSRSSSKMGAEVFVNLKQDDFQTYYQVGKVLGQGAYGKVCIVTHIKTGSIKITIQKIYQGLIRAMKQLKKSQLITEDQKYLFSEMEVLKKMDHPHIVKLFELFQDENSYYLITEQFLMKLGFKGNSFLINKNQRHLAGGELFERIKKMSYFSELKAADFMRQILSAVVYCHQQNIVHRDIKPENILFSSQDSNSPLKIIDFGTSRYFNPDKMMTKRLGTPYYIAPEVLQQNYNQKCDVWSCGVILYILLCGYPPFVGGNEKLILAKVKKGKFTFNQDDWSLISKQAKDLITKMLEIDPVKRISAREALDDPWISKYAKNCQISHKSLDNLQKFQAKSTFRRAILTFIASQMTSQNEIKDLQKQFQAIDHDNDGTLSKSELILGYLNIYNDRQRAEQEVERILELVDINQSGKVDFTEFLMAAMNEENLLSGPKIKQAFKIFDQNGDGKISLQELSNMFNGSEVEVLEDIILEIGEVDYINEDKFTELILKKLEV